MILGLYAVAAMVAWVVMLSVYAAVTAAVCRRAGLPVEAVTVGVGPVLWRWEIRGTRCRLRLLPLGANVKCPLDEGDAATWDETLAAPGSVRHFGDLPLGQQLLITVSGHVVVLLLGMALLAVAVLAATPQLSACERPESMVQPCGMPGLRWNDEATTIAGQATLLRETGIEFIGQMLLFRPLDEWGGMFSAVVTAMSVGKQSFVAWVTLIGLMWTLTGLANFLPLPCLAGFQVVQFTAEAIFGRQRLQSLITPLVLVGFLFLLVMHGRLIWLDLQWIRAQWF